jgi:acyl-CoA thioesterase 11
MPVSPSMLKHKQFSNLALLAEDEQSPGGTVASPKIDTNHGSISMTKLVLPHHANHMGNTFGGEIMEWMDEAASIVAARHSRLHVVTASLDDLFFLAPSTVGDRITIKAKINRTFKTSMEIGVSVSGQTLNGDIKHINKAYFTLVALDASGKVAPIPEFYPEKNDENNTHWKMAAGRRKIRLERRALADNQDKKERISWVWDAIINRELIGKNIECLLNCATGLDKPWSAVREDGEGGVKSWSKEDSNDVFSVKLQQRVCKSMDTVIQYVLDFNKRMKWDKLTKEAEVKLSIDDQNDIIWQKVRVPNSDAFQDFSLLRSWRVGSGIAVLASHSVIHDRVPVVEGVTRGEVMSSGFIIQELPGDECEVVYVAQMAGKSIKLAIDELSGQKSMVHASFKIMKSVIEATPDTPATSPTAS